VRRTFGGFFIKERVLSHSCVRIVLVVPFGKAVLLDLDRQYLSFQTNVDDIWSSHFP
jgi:hypothetical protein